MEFKNLYNQAVAQIENATTDKGILASTILQDNYKRVWSRDSIIAGIAGLLAGSKKVSEGLRASLRLLSRYQLDKGTIPSNVGIDIEGDVSHGSLVGRVDATSWFVVGACLYIKHSQDVDFRNSIKPSIDKALNILSAWEFNNNHLVYTPLSGNWADEYPLHGYLLYDNCLRLWSLRLYDEVFEANTSIKNKIQGVYSAIKSNLWINAQNNERVMHPILYQKQLENKGYFVAGFNPSRYYNVFDCVGNALALICGLFDESLKDKFCDYLGDLFADLGRELVPAFWPPIKETDELWNDLVSNYAYDFKNKPGHFHNGGIWPVMQGWLGLALAMSNRSKVTERMTSGLLQIIEENGFEFQEYIDSNLFSLSGKREMCFTASGIIFLYVALNHKEETKRLLR